MKYEIALTPKQLAFIESDADELLFGGAAGGGKSFAQVIDALVYAVRYPKSRQLLLRRTLPELERTLIALAVRLYPNEIFSYKASSHTGQFSNGSVLEFGYLGGESDLSRYQSAEYDVIRFDELTHFTEGEYLYLRSRLRGTNGYPKRIKSSTNPGSIGHVWVKRRFIESPKEGCEFIPARVQDNLFLMKKDPAYIERLKGLPECERKALLEGCWDIDRGQFFSEFSDDIHVVKPFEIPTHWPRYLSLDYGLDRLAALWFAISPEGDVYCYRELCESSLIISSAAQLIKKGLDESPYAVFAPSDLWNRRQESGSSAADIFAAEGLPLFRVQAPRVSGWLILKEWLKPKTLVDGSVSTKLKFFEGVTETVNCLKNILVSPHNPADTALQPHELTHAPDALRYFAVGFSGGEADIVQTDEQLSALLEFCV